MSGFTFPSWPEPILQVNFGMSVDERRGPFRWLGVLRMLLLVHTQNSPCPCPLQHLLLICQ